MADTDLQQQTLMVAGAADSSSVEEKLQQVTVQEVRVNESGEITAADILQQAFQEASEGYEQVAVAYATVEDGITVLHGPIAEGVLQQVTSGQTVQQVTLTDAVNGTVESNNVAEAAPDPPPQEPAPSNDAQGGMVESLTEFVAENAGGQSVLIPRAEEQAPSEAAAEGEAEEEPEESTSPANSVTIQPVSTSSFQHIALPPKQTSAPLGSSENPIQIIQQGNTYHSTQVLSSEQLQQIAHVLQQQQVNRAIQNGGSAVVFNPQTNTRIIYRVIYPSELGGKSAATPKAGGRGRGVSSGRGRGRPRGRGWSRRVVEDDEHRSEGPELTREEKEERKKHRPRTRSGRISKPPSYMVKDYKRIHHLDFDDEPYDDSDGGYSDYQVSDEEDRRDRKSPHPPGRGGRARNYRCRTCSKQYIGRANLARHLRLYPDHGSVSDMEEGSTHDENSNSSMISGNAQSSPAPNQSQTQRSRYSDMAAIRRKSRLREAMKVCHDEELMEIVMPRLVEAVSLWEFLLMKCEKGDPPRPQVPDMLLNLEELLREIQKLGRECLRSAEPTGDGEHPAEEQLSPGGQYVKIEDEKVAHALGLAPGLYAVQEDNAPGQPEMRGQKRSRSSDGESLAEALGVGDAQAVNEALGDASIVEFVTPEEMVAALHGEPLPPNKRLRLDDEEGIVGLPNETSNMDASKADAGDAIMEAALNSDSLSENMLENLEFAGLQAAEEGAAEGSASQTQALAQQQAQQQLQQKAETLQFVSVGAGQKIQILPGQSLLSRNFVRVVTSSEGPPSPQRAQAAEENGGTETPPAEQVADAAPSEREGAEETQMIIAEPEVNQEHHGSTTEEASSEGARAETTVQVVESHGDEDSEHELAHVVCAPEEGSTEGSAVVRQYLLPDGQIISAYEDGEGGLVQLAGGAEEESATSLGNVVIVQNPDGTTTLQVPSDGSIPIETVQALLAMDHSAMVVHAGQEDAEGV